MCCIIFTNNLPGNHKLSVDWRKPLGYFCCNWNPCLPEVAVLGDTFGWQYVNDGEELIAGSEPGPGLFGCAFCFIFAPFWAAANICCCFNHTGYYFYMEPDDDKTFYELNCKVSWKSGLVGTSNILKGVSKVDCERTSQTYEVQEENDQGQPTGQSHTSEVRQTWMTITHRDGTWKSPIYENHYQDLNDIAFQASQLIAKARQKVYDQDGKGVALKGGPADYLTLQNKV